MSADGPKELPNDVLGEILSYQPYNSAQDVLSCMLVSKIFYRLVRASIHTNRGIFCKINDNVVTRFPNLTRVILCDGYSLSLVGLLKCKKVEHVELTAASDQWNIPRLTNYSLPASIISLKARGVRLADNNISNLGNLTQLDLFLCNGITDKSITRLTALQSLNLAGCFHTSIKLHNAPRSLKKLNIARNCRITNDVFNHVDLLWLSLEGNTVISDRALSTQTNLLYLDLRKNNIITDNGISSLHNLTELDLTSNIRITDAGLEYFKQLKVLHLAGSNITAAGLLGCSSLETIHASHFYVDSRHGFQVVYSKEWSCNVTMDCKLTAHELAGHPSLKTIIFE